MTLTVKAQTDDWNEDVRLTFDENRSDMPSIALWNNHVHVVYFDGPDGGYDGYVRYIRSDDYGKTWSYYMRLSDYSSRIRYPKVAAYEQNIHVVWVTREDNRIHYIRSNDNGNSWSEVISMSIAATYIGYWPDIAVCVNKIYVVHAPDGALYYLRSKDNGVSWSTPIELESGNKAINPKVFADGKNLHVVWASDSDIFYMKSMDDGDNWSSPIRISPSSSISISSSNPRVTVDGDNVHVVYEHRPDFSPYRTVYYSRSFDSGLNWCTPHQLSINDTRNVFFPKVVAKEGSLWTLWVDHRDGTFKMYYKNSFDSGDSWSPDTLLTNESNYPYLPEMAQDTYYVHVIWSDRRDGNPEIYHKLNQLAPSNLNATINIDPNTLNLKSKGKWITCYIELSEGFDVRDIDVSTILLEDTLSPILDPKYGFVKSESFYIIDHDGNGILERMIKFDRSDVQDILLPGNYNLKITGELEDGTLFEGHSDEIRVI